VEKPLWSVCR